MARLLFLAPILVLFSLPVYFIFFKPPPPLPELDLEEWWGQKLKEPDTSIKPFNITFLGSNILDLKERLKRPRSYVPPLEGVAFEYGFNSLQVEPWLKYWVDEYDFNKRETFLNQFPQFKTNIQGLNIHFIRVTPKVPAGVETVPLLLLHGWPGSVREFYESIPLLTAVSKNRNFAIEVIAPSLPGYGYSDAAIRPGLGAPQMAVVMRNLMQRLGYTKYYVQGGDWGSIIGSHMATLFPKEILGFHTNMGMVMHPAATVLELIGAVFPPLIVESHLADRIYPLTKRFSWLLSETGYFHMQATKPDTLGVALIDSPAGLISYILEKFSSWTRPENRGKPDGALDAHFTKEQLIDNLMMYYSSRCITTSMRLYAETFNIKNLALKLDEIPTSVPTWVVQAKYEIAYQPPVLLRFKYKNLVNVSVLDEGGHFLALELPKVFAADVLKAVGEFRKLKSAKTEL